MSKELDLTVFQKEFDPHRRAHQCLRTIKGIKANEHPSIEAKLSKHNQAKLLEYSAKMIERIKEDNFTVPSFEKNLAEAWKLCMFVGSKNIDSITGAELKKWWKGELDRYREKKISYGTLQKQIGCCNTFMKFLKAPERWGTSAAKKVRVENMDDVFLPNKPRPKLKERLPSQQEVKDLLEAMYVDGKRMSVRNRAICALANDSGARISEILSTRNKHVRPEENYLVVDLPISKTAPRTIVAFISKKHLEEWAKISPNRNKGGEAFFFCQGDGNPVGYASLAKEFSKALKKTGLPWVRGVHFFRHIFISRAASWPAALKCYWTGLTQNGHEGTYSHITYKQCVPEYFKMLKEEENPMLGEEALFWETESDLVMRTLNQAMQDPAEQERVLKFFKSMVLKQNGMREKILAVK